MHFKRRIILSKIILLGAFPPPITGMAVTTAAMRDFLIKNSLNPITIDISPLSLNRAWYLRLLKAPKVFLGFLSFIFHSFFLSRGVLYIGISGGLGQAYEIPFIAIARILKWNIYIHHHSYAYINQKKWLTALLIKLSGTDATHITLCQNMSIDLQKSYASEIKTFHLSNIAFFNLNTVVPKKSITLQRIGYLSNISEKKGISIFLDLIEMLEDSEIAINALIAGPFEDDIIKEQVMLRVDTSKLISYIGSVYGDKKESFFKSIDVLVFPSQYENEAEPIIILESLSHGVPVITTKRGCIDELVNRNVGLVINDEKNFVNLAKQQLMEWKSNPTKLTIDSNAARDAFLRLYERNNVQLTQLYQSIKSDAIS